MDLLKNMNGALNYIEENLTNDIDFKEVARLAFCSEFHFKRMFSFLTGISMSVCEIFLIKLYFKATGVVCEKKVGYL